jgi:hypothetical protein
VSSAILTERIRQAVTRALEQINGDLERLVDQELDRQLRTLVDERLAARNGHSLQAQPVQTAQLCKTCGERLAPRAAPSAAAAGRVHGPRSPPSRRAIVQPSTRRIPDRRSEILPSQLVRRVGDRYGAVPADKLASWLVRSGFAVTSENGALSPTAAARSLGASLE